MAVELSDEDYEAVLAALVKATEPYTEDEIVDVSIAERDARRRLEAYRDR